MNYIWELILEAFKTEEYIPGKPLEWTEAEWTAYLLNGDGE